MAKKRSARRAAKRSSRKPAKSRYSRHVKNLKDFFGITGKKSERVIRTAKVGVVTALVGGIFKAIALTETFPQPFDTYGNVILFLAFMIMLAAFLLGKY
jgi:hypothetical protein